MYIWNHPGLNNNFNIEATVAIPVRRMKNIIWISLESLRLQRDVNFDWELIIYDDDDSSLELIKKFSGELPGCKKIIYKVEDNEPKLLIDKWITIGKMSSLSSKFYAMQAGDVFSPNKMLKNHYKNFKKNNCLISTYSSGYFYHVGLGKFIIYNGKKIEDSSFLQKMHLYPAIKTDDIRKVPSIKQNRRIDKYIRDYICKINNVESGKDRFIFDINSVDENDWCTGFNTDGFNTISYRRSFYNNPRGVWSFPENDLESPLEENILEFLNNIKHLSSAKR